MNKWMTAATLGMFLSAPIVGHAETAGASQAEIDQLKGQVAALLARVEQLEKAQATAPAAEPAPAGAGPGDAAVAERLVAVEETNDRQTDQIAQGLASTSAMDWARNIKWKGDLRYRNESFDVEGTSSDRVRDRLRVRFGLEAKVSPTLLVGIGVATGEGRDARSTNSTLDSASQNEEIGLDLAYVDWRPRPDMLVTLGKQKQPWFKAGNSLFFDGDVNPEGASFQYGTKTGLFAKAWGYWLEEMASAADSNVIGGQVGYAFGNGLTLAAGYWDYGAVQDQPALVFSGTPAGNSTYTANSACTPSPTGTVRCYTYDYDIAAADLQWAGRIGAMPITLFGGYLENMDPDDLNTGYNLGFLLGKAADQHTWEFGALYMDVEQDAQMAAFLDSDFADGKTQGRGYVLQGSWAPVKNMTMKATYFLNDRDYDTTAEVEYKRLQLDLNYKF
jgi:outer membrane murein-binding lipoprotein Lpp